MILILLLSLGLWAAIWAVVGCLALAGGYLGHLVQFLSDHIVKPHSIA